MSDTYGEGVTKVNNNVYNLESISQNVAVLDAWSELKRIVIESFDLLSLQVKMLDPETVEKGDEIKLESYRVLQFFNKLYLSVDLYSMQTQNVIESVRRGLDDDVVRRFVLELQSTVVMEWLGAGFKKEDIILLSTAATANLYGTGPNMVPKSLLGTSVISRLSVYKNYLYQVVEADLWYGLLILIKAWFPHTAFFNNLVEKEDKTKPSK